MKTIPTINNWPSTIVNWRWLLNLSPLRTWSGTSSRCQRFESRIIRCCSPLNWEGQNQIISGRLYSTSGKLVASAKESSAQGRSTALATNCHLNHIAELNNRTIFGAYVGQLFDPANWQVPSYHNQAGRRLVASTTANDPEACCLLEIGDRVNSTQRGSQRRSTPSNQRDDNKVQKAN